MKFADSFSPLFIGEGSSTRSKASTPPTGWHLSVPSSSGKGLQRSLQRGHHGASRAFSPLFIGEGSSTRATRQNKPGLEDFQSPLHRGRVFNDCGERLAPFVHLSFQSPLHRGRVFNLRRYDLEYAKDILSVPSSSGKGLQRPYRPASREPLFPFSPLFIGEGSSTRLQPKWQSVFLFFQSPLHRGRVFNRAGPPGPAKPASSFSPLFIGEGSSTVAAWRCSLTGASFQSPLHRGRVFN